MTPPWMFSKEFLETFWQAILYNTIENAHSKVFMGIRKNLGTKCLKDNGKLTLTEEAQQPNHAKFRQLQH